MAGSIGHSSDGLQMTQRFARARRAPVCAALMLTGAILTSAMVTNAAHAQTPADGAAKPAATKPAAASKAPAGGSAAAAAPSNESALKQRVEQLEEQLVDMQVVVGTLESLAKSGGGASSNAFRSSGPTAGGGADAGRVEALEQQVRALSTQLQQLQEQMRAGGGARRTDAGTPPPVAAASAFGSTTVTPGNGDAIGGLISSDAPVPSGAASASSASSGGLGATPAPVATAALGPAGEPSDPKQLYETAYGHLLQRNYGAAEASFDDFLKRFPNDSLSGNAQYWLGETHFVRGQYKAAAGAFLKGYQTYAAGQKAPDSLLKLAMSLDRLGQKDAACSSFSELNTKFPNAPQSVKARAQSERQRVGCP